MKRNCLPRGQCCPFILFFSWMPFQPNVHGSILIPDAIHTHAKLIEGAIMKAHCRIFLECKVQPDPPKALVFHY